MKRLRGVLTHLAKQKNKSISSLAKELILEALDRREDMVLSAIAETREAEQSETVSHGDVWK